MEGPVVLNEKPFQALLSDISFRLCRMNNQSGVLEDSIFMLIDDILCAFREAAGPKGFYFHVIWAPWEENKTKRQLRKLSFEVKTEDERSKWISAINSRALKDASNSKGLIKVLVNPYGGKKEAPSIWAKVQRVFDWAGLKYEVSQTEYSGHARKIAETIDPEKYGTILVVSGDGLFHEVLNGLLKREDWQKAKAVRLGVIPAGSGNGLAASLQSADPLTAAFHIAKGRSRPLDIIAVVQGEKTTYCFLSVSWGLISDLDIGSEGYRWMGPARFSFRAIGHVLSPPQYKGRVCFLEDKAVRLQSTEKLLDQELQPADTAASPVPSQSTSTTILNDLITHDVKTPPASWTVADDHFLSAVATNATHISSDCHFAPKAQFNDGFADLLIMRKATRGDLIGLTSSMENGTHINHPGMEYYKVKAFSIEPVTPGYFSLDGESTPYVPLKAQIHPSLVTLVG
jgi:diacylglycerol kinase family enzyme